MAARGERRREEDERREDEAHAAEIADGLLDAQDRRVVSGGDARRLARIFQPQTQQPNSPPGRVYVDNADGIVQAWKDTVYAPTEEEFNNKWALTEQEFVTQKSRFPNPDNDQIFLY